MAARKCSECGRILTDPESVKLGYGPDCAEKVSSNVAAIGAKFGITAEQWSRFQQKTPSLARNAYAAFKANRPRHIEVFLKAGMIS